MPAYHPVESACLQADLESHWVEIALLRAVLVLVAQAYHQPDLVVVIAAAVVGCTLVVDSGTVVALAVAGIHPFHNLLVCRTVLDLNVDFKRYFCY